METTELGLSLGGAAVAGVVILAAFTNFIQNVTQVLGIGTAISLGLGTVKVILDMRENQRRKRREGIQRLTPVVYGPLLKWTKSAEKTLGRQVSDEVYLGIGGPPDLSEEADFVALVGDTLQTSVNETKGAFEACYKLNHALREEYRGRMAGLLKKSGLQWDISSVYVQFDNQPLGISDAPFQYTLEYVRQRTANSQVIQLVKEQERRDFPKDLLNPLTNLEELRSFLPFISAKRHLLATLSRLDLVVTTALQKGEADWKLS